MWYKTALQYNLFGTLNRGNKKTRTRFFAEDEEQNEQEDAEINQLPNVQEPEEEVPQNDEPTFTPVPVQVDPVIGTPVGVENKTPLPINLPPGFIAPPVHEFCHCEIKTMPSGRQV